MAAGAMVASVLGSMAALASMAVTLAICCLFWRKRGRDKEAKDELEPLQTGLVVSKHNSQPQQQQQQVTPVKKTGQGLTGHDLNTMYQGSSPSASSSPISGSKGATPKEKEKASCSSPAAGAAAAVASSSSAATAAMMEAFNAGAEEFEDAEDDSDLLEPAGQIQFSLEYDFYKSQLVLRIIQGKDLPAKDIIGTSDPYVKVTLLPDKKRKLETKVKHRTLNPRWNETFYFQGFPLHKLQKSILHLNVYDWDRFSRDDPIGEVFLPLAKVDFTQKPTIWKSLKPAETCKLGDLLISLMYVPRTSELSIGFLKARRLKAKDITGASDPYVKIWIIRGEKRMEKRKTRVIKSSLNPVFEECFTFTVSWEHIRETSFAVTVMDWDHVGRNEPIGGIVLSSKSGPGEARHWGQMLNKPRVPTIQWHKLKPL